MAARSQRVMARAPVAPRNVSRSRAQLSSEMTRLEFERERLSRDLDTLVSRLEATERAMTKLDGRLAHLQRALAL